MCCVVHHKTGRVTMTNRELFGTGPQDVDYVRREMMSKLDGKHRTNEIENFFYNKVNPTVMDFFEWVKSYPYCVNAPQTALLYGQRNKLDANDYYNVMKSGVEVTGDEWLFYYYIYATSAPEPPWDDYTVFIKSDGKYRIIYDLEACSKEALFDDVKQSFLEAKAKLESL
jgi:hypothetical protein